MDETTTKPMTVYDLIKKLLEFHPQKPIYYQVCQSSALSYFDIKEEECVKFIPPGEGLFMPQVRRKRLVVIKAVAETPRLDYVVEIL